MGWATVGNVTTTHLDSSADDPSQARAEIYSALLELQNVINGRGTASGVAPLDAASKVTTTYLPDTLASSILAPAAARVTVQDILNLTPKTVSELEAIETQEGDVAYCSDGDAGSPCLAVATDTVDSTGATVWLKIALGSQISAT